MSVVMRHESTERKVMFSVPLPCVVGDLGKALNAAVAEAIAHPSVNTNCDDWATVTSDGDTLTITFTVSMT